MARREFLCHGHGGAFPHRPGADLHCSEECAGQHQAAQEILEAALRERGFAQVEEIPNLWVKDGVHISIEQVMREGVKQAFEKHQEACAAR